MKTYPLTYYLKFHDPEISKDDITPEQGAADDLVVISVVHGPDDERSYAYAAVEGETREPLGPDELFKAWVVFGIMLSENFGISDPRSLIPRGVLEEVKALASLEVNALAGQESTTEPTKLN